MILLELGLVQKQTSVRPLFGSSLSVMSPPGNGTNGGTQPALMSEIFTAKTKYDVLVVDDDDSFRTSFVVTLKDLTDLEMTVVEVDSGEAAVTTLENNPDRFDVIFLDLTLPGINGCTVEKGLRGLGFKKPIIIMSSDVNSTDADLARSKGLNVLDKNLIFNEIRDLLSSPWSN